MGLECNFKDKISFRVGVFTVFGKAFKHFFHEKKISMWNLQTPRVSIDYFRKCTVWSIKKKNRQCLNKNFHLVLACKMYMFTNLCKCDILYTYLCDILCILLILTSAWYFDMPFGYKREQKGNRVMLGVVGGWYEHFGCFPFKETRNVMPLVSMALVLHAWVASWSLHTEHLISSLSDDAFTAYLDTAL